MTAILTVGFDLFGTLVDAHAEWKVCVLLMCKHLQQCGYEISDDDFVANYQVVVREYRKIRHETFREVNNCVWLADVLKKMGMEIEASSPDVVSAVEKYFGAWRLDIVPDAPMVLERLSGMFRILLVSNFTHDAFVHRSLVELGIEKYFDHIITSDALGWRKPHPNIFKRFLKLSKAKAEEAVFIGDELETDIMGAKNMGIKAALLDRPGRVRNQKKKIDIFPDHTVNSLTEFAKLFQEKYV